MPSDTPRKVVTTTLPGGVIEENLIPPEVARDTEVAAAVAAHAAETTTHGATSANTAGRIVARDANGLATLSGVVIDPAATPTQAQGMLRWNADEETVDVGLSATDGISIGAELTPRYRNGTGSTIAAGAAVYISGSTGTHTNIALAQANALLPSRDCIGIVTTDAGIANNQRGRVCTYGVSHNHNTSGFSDGAEVWLSPTVAGGLTPTEPTTVGHFKVLIGKVQRSHATLGEIFVDPHFLGSVTGDGVSSATSQANARTALGLGSLATQSGTFSGTSSGTNTGDQTITLTGDVTGSGTGSFAATVAANAITNAKLAQVATQTFKGRNTAATGDVEDLSVSTVKTMLAISNVDNTSDSNKPVSTATQTALNLKADSTSLAFRGDYLQSDGATSNRAQIQGPFDATYNPRGWLAGAASATWRGVVTVPTSNPSSYIHIAICYSISVYGSPYNYTITIEISNTGELRITQTGASAGSNYRTFLYSGFISSYSGKVGILEVGLTQGTTNPVARWNGVDISSTFSLTTGAVTTPNWLDASMVPTYHLTGYNWPSGPAPVGSWILGTLTSAESLAWIQTGKPPAWVAAGGSCAGQTSGTLTIGRQYIIHSYLGSDNFTNVGAASNSTGTVFTATGTTPTTWTSSTIIRQLGALSLPSIQPIPVLDDVTTIGGNPARLLGMTPVCNKTSWRISANTWTNGNQQILAGSVLDSTKDVIDDIEQNTSGTPTTTIGSDSAGAQYKASSALTAGINPVTVVTRKLASNDVWVNSNSTAVVRTTIKGHRTT